MRFYKTTFHAIRAILYCRVALLWISFSQATPYFSEIFANPQTLEDSQGEFLEVYCPEVCDTLTISINQKKIWNAKINKKGFVLFCASPTFHPSCLPLSESLVNSSPNTLQLWQNQKLIDSTQTPIAEAGRSWERDKLQWAPSTYQYNHEYQTPGFGDPIYFPSLNNQSISIQSQAFTQDTITIKATLEGNPPFAIQQKQLYTQSHFTRTDTLSTNTYNSHLFTRGALWSVWQLENTLDEVPNPATILFQQIQASLFISEIFPFPKELNVEWIELYNNSPNSFPLSQTKFHIGTSSFTPKDSSSIPPFSHCILTSSKTQWLSEYTITPKCLLETSSFSMNNQGGQILWKIDSTVIDSFFWPKATEDDFDHSIEKTWDGSKWIYFSQEYTPDHLGESPPQDNHFEILQRSGNLQQPIQFQHQIKANDALQLKIFDRSGLLVWKKTIEQSGTDKTIWNTLDQSSRQVQPGLYILLYNFKNESPRQKAIAVAPHS